MTAEVYLEGTLVRMISMRVPVFTDLGWYGGSCIDNFCEIEGIKLRFLDGRGVKHIPV
jgi:hypothetical protein